MDDSSRPIPLSRREFQVLAGGSLAAAFTGCGTLMHPERMGQSRDGRLDWTIVGMDAIGLIFFFVPGLIAFAIDFYNGTIFYPAAYGAYGMRDGGRGELNALHLNQRYPTLSEVAEAVSQEIGRPVRLSEGRYASRELASLDEFWPTHDKLSGAAS